MDGVRFLGLSILCRHFCKGYKTIPLHGLLLSLDEIRLVDEWAYILLQRKVSFYTDAIKTWMARDRDKIKYK